MSHGECDNELRACACQPQVADLTDAVGASIDDDWLRVRRQRAADAKRFTIRLTTSMKLTRWGRRRFGATLY